MQPAAVTSRTGPDIVMRRLLRIPDQRGGIGDEAVRRGFSRSMLISASRCLLTYVVLPFVAPALGWAAGIGPVIGIPVGVVAIVANVVSIRRFWLADHRWRWRFTIVSVAVMVLLVILLAEDFVDLVT